MKKLLCFSVLLLACDSRSVPPPATGWLVTTHTAGASYLLHRGTDIAADPDGMVYVTGFFKDHLTLGSTALSSAGNNDLFVAKLSPEGQLLWVVSAGGAQNDEALALDLDQAGNAYITGSFQGEASFGPTTLTTTGSSDGCFLAKVSLHGEFLWAAASRESPICSGRDVAVDEEGNATMVGEYRTKATFGDVTLTSRAHSEMFMARYTSDGDNVWALSSQGHEKWTSGASVALGPDGSAHVVGTFSRLALGPFNMTSARGTDLYLAKVSSAGELVWVTRAGGTAQRKSDIAVDPDGNVYVRGSITGAGLFNTSFSTKEKQAETVLAKLSPEGKPLWVNRALDQISPPHGGSYQLQDRSGGLLITEDGDLLVAGIFYGEASVGAIPLSSEGICGGRRQAAEYPCGEIYLASYSNSGEPRWAISAGGPFDDVVNAVTLGTRGNIYATGLYQGEAVFGDFQIEAPDESQRPPSGAFIWKLGTL